MYVATKGGEAAIGHAHDLLRRQRAPRTGTVAVQPEQIIDQMWLGISRVMAEGSMYDPELCARAIAQAQGDIIEAIFLVRAYRATLPRFGVSIPIETSSMRISRRVSATFKDVPGGQLLGPTFDYSHRLIELDEPSTSLGSKYESPLLLQEVDEITPGRVLDLLDRDGLIERVEPGTDELLVDLTREPLRFPIARPTRLQNLARGDEGFLLALGYSTQRGYGSTHPFAGEIRIGKVDLMVQPDELDFPIVIGEIEVTECEMVNQFVGSSISPPHFTRGYGLVFGQGERKAMSMALVDRAMRAEEFGEESTDAPAADIEFVLSHSDSLESSGFVQHLKLPHYVDFQSELVMIRELRDQWEKEHDQAHTFPEDMVTEDMVTEHEVDA
jgi:alpha-D-ribose 1-methylphosphonate 5-triphosphate synthase subunit PhnI